MVLVEQTEVPSAALPVTTFRNHLRLGTGFSDDAIQDELLEEHLRAAMATIEARTGKILIQRSFSWRVTAWRDLAKEYLPVAPVSQLTRFAIIEGDDSETVIDPGRYRLVPDTHRPAVASTGFLFPILPVGGVAEITFDAGFGSTWTEVPRPVSQAVMMLAGHYYSNRTAVGDGKILPEGVDALIASFRPVRLWRGVF
ncbi:MAG: head-tail connector protein [Pseudomonadota bacterium]